MIVNWFIGSLDEGHHLKELVTAQDMRTLASHFCSLLLSVGVLKQIEKQSESPTTPNSSEFRVNFYKFLQKL